MLEQAVAAVALGLALLAVVVAAGALAVVLALVRELRKKRGTKDSLLS